MKRIFWILLSAVVVCACSDDDVQEAPQPVDTIAVGAETLEFLPSGQIVSEQDAVVVTSSGAWRLAGRKTWCRPSVTAGESGDRVTFTAEPNPEPEPRSEVFTFICGSTTARLVVRQAGDRIVECSGERFDLDNAGGLIRLSIESNVAVSAEIDPDGAEWITPYLTDNGTRAMQTQWRYYRVAPNPTYYPRRGAIVLSGEGMEPRSLPVLQAQTDMLSLEGEPDYKGGLTAGQLRLTVWSNIAFEVVIPEDARSWVTLERELAMPERWSSQEMVLDIAAADGFRMTQVHLKTARPELDRALLIQQGEPRLLHFPDQNFREYLIGQGYIVASGDGYLLTAEGKAVTAMDLYTPLWQKGGIASAEGIENFTNLADFDCRYGRLRALDLSATQVADLSKCVPNAIETLVASPSATTIDFGPAYSWGDGSLYDYTTKSGGYPYTYYWSQSFVVTGENLRTIKVSQNKLTMLDVAGCPNLETLDCRMQDMMLETLYMSESQRGRVVVTKDDNTRIVYK